MSKVYTRAIFIVAGIGAFIEAQRYVPVPAQGAEGGLVSPATGLSNTGYDLLRLGGWVLVVFGVIAVASALVEYAVRYRAEWPGSTARSANRASLHGEDSAHERLLSVKPLHPGTFEAAPWDDGPYGEAVQPSAHLSPDPRTPEKIAANSEPNSG
jgi:hypothetical protein